MIKMFKDMQNDFKNEIRSMKRELANTTTPHIANDNNHRGESRNRNRKTPDNPSFARRTTNKYCWTHGGCAHSSAGCNAKASGHQDSATFNSMQGGSKGFCQ